MGSRAFAKPSVVLAAILVVMTVMTWRWQGQSVRTRHVEGTGEPWDRVKRVYPMSDASPTTPALPNNLLERMVQANPFSPKRRFVVPPESGGGPPGEPGGASEPATPAFLYKGRVTLGARQRAVLQETTSGKTYFLEVGQEVAGFKVLDIKETQVLLSNTKTREEITVALSTATRP